MAPPKIEWHAVNRATDYEDEGFTVVSNGAYKPYDLYVKNGSEQRQDEVAGSSGATDTEEMTHGEIVNWWSIPPTDLYVVDGICWARKRAGTVSTRGSQVRRWWTRQQSPPITAIRFRCKLPNAEGSR